MLDTARPDAENGRCLLFQEPAEVLTTRRLDEVVSLLKRADEAVQAGRYVAGYVAYEAGYALDPHVFEELTRPEAFDAPLMWLGIFERAEELDEDDVQVLLQESGRYFLSEPEFSLDQNAHEQGIDAVKRYIRAGDVYQINYTGRFRFEVKGDPLGLYAALRSRQPVSYAAYIDAGDHQVLSLSPELFFARAGQRIWTRPMKGTIHRGETEAEDERLAEFLRTDAKSRAENLMIVDLLRNDLSVLSEPGSVRVPDLFTTTPYETLIQMTSTVEGRLQNPEITYTDIFRALFPCGSVTGAPKLRSMQVIHELEPQRRGVYTGAIGYIGPDQEATFNVAIRTVVVRGEAGEMGTGGGIVWDSEAGAEYDEALLKAQFLREAFVPFQLIETMRWHDGACALLPYHLDRLERSAAYFGMPFERSSVESALLDRMAQTEGTMRGRLLYGFSGLDSITAQPLADVPDRPWTLCWASEPIDSTDPFYRHKTTRRTLYTETLHRVRAAGFDDALFLNERGEIAEGCITNVVAELDGRRVTPPLSSGCLPGVYRAYLIAEQGVEEAVLFPEDLARADALWVCNAVLQRFVKSPI
ncbi:MAG: aminodeoxychorismate synthase component I [Bacteroidota bacterium]